jgi:hypothetical protein
MIAIGSHGLKRYLKGCVKQPNGVVIIDIGTAAASNMVHSIDGTTIATEDEIKEAEKKLDEYKQWECAVKQTLYGSISNHRLIEIKNLTTAAEAWKKLCSLHEDKSEIVAVDRRAHLQNLRMQEGGDVHAHISEMERICEELSRLGAPVNDSDFGVMLLSSLLQSYHPMVQTMLAIACKSSSKLTPELIVAHLTINAEYQDTLNQNMSQNSTLSASTGRKKPKRGGKKESAAVSSDKKKCFNCRRPGHWKDDC